MEEKKQGFFGKFIKGLSKTGNNLLSDFDNVFGLTEIDEDFYEELEEILIMADLGVATTTKIVDLIRDKVRDNRLKKPAEVEEVLKESLKEIMASDDDLYAFEEEKSVVLVVGVNGVGKTTTIAKLAAKLKADGESVILAAGDTFRAAAIEQLEMWADRIDVPIVKSEQDADPGSVIFDAVSSMRSKNASKLICDTSGRLHNKKNLMNELIKLFKIIDKNMEGVRKEVLLVLDATTGQNALAQAKEFETIGKIDGIVLTKLDGTAKGGIAIAIKDQLEIPIKYIGVGEQVDDLVRFDVDKFVDALFSKDEK